MNTFENGEDFLEYMEQLLGEGPWSAEQKAFALGALVIVDLADEYPEWADLARAIVNNK